MLDCNFYSNEQAIFAQPASLGSTSASIITFLELTRKVAAEAFRVPRDTCWPKLLSQIFWAPCVMKLMSKETCITLPGRELTAMNLTPSNIR